MDFLTLLLLLSSILSILFLSSISSISRTRSKKLPPGPFAIPIIGNILQLSQNPHRSLAELSKTYGPLMHLKLGSLHTIVVSSPQMAKEILQKHDRICSGRIATCAVQVMDHDKGSIAWQPVGEKWGKYRKICKEYMFMIHKLEESKGLYREKLQQLSDYLAKCCLSGQAVDIEEVAFVTQSNLVFSTMFSIEFTDFDSGFAPEIKGNIRELLTILGTHNLADYFPILRLFDPQDVQRNAGICFTKLLTVIDEIINERLKSREVSKKNDLLEAILDLNQENDFYFSQNDIKHFLLDIIIAAIDTTSGAVQWVIAELLHNPEKMLKAKNELRAIVGANEQVKESDISRLLYLNAVIKETFRCHPPGPLLIPHKAEAEVEIDGYMIPKDAQILVNAWAISRDSSIWSNPNSFEPERFFGSKIDYRGQDFELLSFGSGRRSCPGLPLAHTMVHLMAATFIHGFEWKVEQEALDMHETFGIALHKVVPLKAVPIKE